MVDTITHTDDEWRKLLTPEEYHMLREGGTEPPFHNKYHDNKKKGIYTCAGCGLDLFSSDAKFDSGTGWPSFWAPIAPTMWRPRQTEALAWYGRRSNVHAAGAIWVTFSMTVPGRPENGIA